MKIHFYIILSLSFFVFSSYAQEYLPCGTPPGKSKWLRSYQEDPAAYRKDDGVLLYVPLSLHITGNDGGQGYMPASEIVAAMCRLNQDFLQADLQFFIDGEFNYINSTLWHFHETILEGTEMMNANNIPNTINCYINNTAAGNAGYNLPHADGVALRRASIGPNDHTWAHEVGHNLSIQHPFLGWEGGVSYDGSVTHNYASPAPLTVLYDYTLFKDTLILDTLIIDTAFVEFVDGSNCAIAADGFCDTPPDYLSLRWQCNADSASQQLQTDPTGAQFQSDGRLIMSYSFDNCQSVFSGEQIAAMRANLFDEKPGHLSNQNPNAAPITDNPVLLSPIQGESAPPGNVQLVWNSVPNASHYIVQVNRLPNFNGTFAVTEILTTDTSFLLTNSLNEGFLYYWRVKPFNQGFVCTEFSQGESFLAMGTTAVREIEDLLGMALRPNPGISGSSVSLDLHLANRFEGKLSVFGSDGKLWKENEVNLEEGYSEFIIPTDNLPPGMYVIVLHSLEGKAYRKLAIIR